MVTLLLAYNKREGDSPTRIMFDAEIQQHSKAKSKKRSPSMYALVMLNDDYTPMDFVVKVLKRFIRMNTDKATHTMLAIHLYGEGHCGVYTRDIGETKITQIHTYAKKHGHPLRCILRKTQG